MQSRFLCRLWKWNGWFRQEQFDFLNSLEMYVSFPLAFWNSSLMPSGLYHGVNSVEGGSELHA